MKKKGFTLIELLAVIIILAVIALIATPVVLDIIEQVKREAFRATATSITEAGELKCGTSKIYGESGIINSEFENNEEISEDKMTEGFQGKLPDSGYAASNENCETAIAVWDESLKVCAYKDYSENKVILIDMEDKSKCNLETKEYVDTSSTGYSCSNLEGVTPTEEKYFTFDQTTGTITDYSDEGPKEVVIPCTIGGVNVTAIGNSAFYKNELTSVIMPDTIITLASYSFYGNPITTLALGNSVETIGQGSFTGNKLEELIIPDSVKTINSSINPITFSSSTLKKVVFGSGIEEIGTGTFDGVRTLTEVDFSRSTNLKTIGSFAFRWTGISSLDLSNNKSLDKIDSYAFNDSKLTSVKLYGTNLVLGNYSFEGNLLEEIVLDGIITLEKDVFKDNQMSSEYAYIYGSYNNGVPTDNVLNSYAGADRGSIIIPDNITTVTATFSGLGINGTFDSGNGLTEIVSSMFTNNSLTEVIIRDSVKTVGMFAFENNNIETVTIGNGVTLIDQYSFRDNPIKTLTLGNSLETIAYQAFNTNKLEELVFPDSLKKINSFAFENTTLKKVVFGSGIETIGQNAFNNAKKLEEIDLSRSTNLKTIGSSAFRYSKLISLDLSNNKLLEKIGGYAFSDGILSDVKIYGNNMTIEYGAFENNLIEDLQLSGVITSIGQDTFKNNQLDSEYAYIYGSYNDGIPTDNVLTSYAGADRGSIIIPDDIITSTATFSGLGLNGIFDSGDGLTEITGQMFSRNALTEVIIGDSVKTIDMFAFSDNEIEKVTLGNSLTLIDKYAFEDNNIKTLIFGNSLEKIAYEAFKNNQLEEIIFPDSLININSYVFENNSLKKVVFGSGLEKVAQGAFEGNADLAEVDFSKSINLKTIGQGCFQDSSLTSVDLSNNKLLETIDGNAFEDNKLIRVKLYGNNLEIGPQAFHNNSINELELNGVISSIGRDAFKDNKMTNDYVFIYESYNNGVPTSNVLSSYAGANRSNIKIPDNVTTATSTFNSLDLTGTVDTGNGLTEIIYAMFRDNEISGVIIGDSVTTIGYYSFYNNKITNVEIGDSVTFIDKNAFERNLISTLTLGDNVQTISASSFNNNNLTKVEIPSSVTKIGGGAFASNKNLSEIFVKGKVDSTNFASLGSSWNGTCNNIIYELASCYVYSGNTITDYQAVCSKNIEIPSVLGGNTITTIADNAFSNKGLTKVVIPSTITNIGNNAFSDNSILPVVVLGKGSETDFVSLGTNWNGGNKTIYENTPQTCLMINDGVLSERLDDNFCSNYVDIVIPNSVTTISKDTFKGKLLNSITVENGTRINSFGDNWNGTVYKVDFQGDSYEYNCFTLEGSKVTGYKQYCSATVDLTKPVQGVTITEIGNNAFKNAAINNITLSGNITSIGASAFEGNDIESVYMQEGLVTIGDKAFYNTGLKEVYIPRTVTSIGTNAFGSNPNLESITLNGITDISGLTLGSSWNGTCNNIIYN